MCFIKITTYHDRSLCKHKFYYCTPCYVYKSVTRSVQSVTDDCFWNAKPGQAHLVDLELMGVLHDGNFLV